MTRARLRQRLAQAVGCAALAATALVVLVIVRVVAAGREVEALHAELDARFAGVAPEVERAGIARLARAARPEAPPADLPAPDPVEAEAATAPSPAGGVPQAPMPAERDEERDPRERALHDWLRELRMTRTQPGPPPPPRVTSLLAELGPDLDELVRHLADRHDPAALLVAPAEREARQELERARVLLLAAAGAEWLSPEGDAPRGERMLEGAWRLALALPVGIDDAGPGDLFLAVVRQARVGDARAWSARIEELAPRTRLAEALEWDAAARMARLRRVDERRRHAKAGSMPAPVQRVLASVATKHDAVFVGGQASAEMALAREVRALDGCADPWTLETFTKGPFGIDGPGPPGEVRLRVAMASASLQQADSALTRHVLLRRHGLEAPRDACGAQVLVERHEGGDRYVVGWRAPGGGGPGPSDRRRPGNHSEDFRTWPEPSLPGPSLEPFRFEAPPLT